MISVYRAMIAVVLAGGSTLVDAQSVSAGSGPAYPVKPIRVVLPYSAGASADLQSRALAQKMTENLGQTVIVDNRAGANGNIAMEFVAKSAPDGYTLVYALTAQFAINPSLYPKIPYDPVRDFEPITVFVRSPFVLFMHPSVPAKSMKELIVLAKAQPGKLVHVSAGSGATGHLCLEMLKSITGIDILNVPYRGAAPASIDLIAGHAQLSFLAWSTVGGHVKTGKLRALGVTTAKRAPALPDLPAISETLPGYDLAVWYGMAAPAGTPKPIIARLNAEILRVLAVPEFRRDFEKEAMEPIGNTPEQFRDYIRSEIVKWAKVVKDSGATID